MRVCTIPPHYRHAPIIGPGFPTITNRVTYYGGDVGIKTQHVKAVFGDQGTHLLRLSLCQTYCSRMSRERPK